MWIVKHLVQCYRLKWLDVKITLLIAFFVVTFALKRKHKRRLYVKIILLIRTQQYVFENFCLYFEQTFQCLKFAIYQAKHVFSVSTIKFEMIKECDFVEQYSTKCFASVDNIISSRLFFVLMLLNLKFDLKSLVASLCVVVESDEKQWHCACVFRQRL